MRICAGALILAITASTIGCTEPTQQQPASVNNISGKPLMIKDLALGQKYEEKSFPKILFQIGETISFKYDYFGQEQVVKASLNADQVIYSYEILFRGDLTDLRTAIEQKVSSENGNEVRFSCTTDENKLGGMDWENKSCQIVSGTQILLVEENKPVSEKPSSISPSTWEVMHMGKLLLEDSSLAASNSNRLENETRQKLEEDKANSMKDV